MSNLQNLQTRRTVARYLSLYEARKYASTGFQLLTTTATDNSNGTGAFRCNHGGAYDGVTDLASQQVLSCTVVQGDGGNAISYHEVFWMWQVPSDYVAGTDITFSIAAWFGAITGEDPGPYVFVGCAKSQKLALRAVTSNQEVLDVSNLAAGDWPNTHNYSLVTASVAQTVLSAQYGSTLSWTIPGATLVPGQAVVIWVRGKFDDTGGTTVEKDGSFSLPRLIYTAQ